MRKLLLVLLFIPSLCLANSAECGFFIGVSSDGQITIIGTRNDWDGSAFQFGVPEDPKLRYCEQAKNYSFQCRSKRDENPNVIYKNGDYDDSNSPSSDLSKKFGIRHKEARAYFEKVMAFIKGKKIETYYDSSRSNYFTCDKACDNKEPHFISSSGHIGGQNIKAYYDGYFICDKGCDDKKPLFIYSAGYVECD